MYIWISASHVHSWWCGVISGISILFEVDFVGQANSLIEHDNIKSKQVFDSFHVQWTDCHRKPSVVIWTLRYWTLFCLTREYDTWSSYNKDALRSVSQIPLDKNHLFETRKKSNLHLTKQFACPEKRVWFHAFSIAVMPHARWFFSDIELRHKSIRQGFTLCRDFAWRINAVFS